MDSRDFSRKTDSTRRNRQMHTWMKARDVKKENQMKSKLFRGNISTRKGEVPFLKAHYHPERIAGISCS